jgi:epoxyqueuosine reductase
MNQVLVVDREGEVISPCSRDKAQRLFARGQATLESDDLLTIRLNYNIKRTHKPPKTEITRYDGQRILLHICCGPCATYTVQHMRELGWDLQGLWYNPNIQPDMEYSQRRLSLANLAEQIAFPMIWDLDSDDTLFQTAVQDHEQFGERCAICYRLRLQRTAQVAAERGIGTISTSLLISPYQDLAAIHQIGDQVAAEYSLRFYYENLRRGYHERTRLSRQYGLYLQTYCGCLYSAREAEARRSRKATLVVDPGSTGVSLANQ